MKIKLYSEMHIPSCPFLQRRKIGTRIGILTAFATTMFVGGTTMAQAVSNNPYGGAKAAENSDETGVSENDTKTETLIKRLEAVEKKADEALQENTALKARLEEQTAAATSADENAEISERLEMLEDANFQRIQEEEHSLRIYGFADVQWYKFFYKKGTIFDGSLNKNNSFAVGHWNLYLEKPLSDKFRFLGEVRLLFQPYGEEVDIEMDGTLLGIDSTKWGRVNTTATDWVDAYYFDWGGISIQRLWVEYKYSDVFGVRAGNFLTPVGLWNVDHASTVVIPAHRPFLITAQLLPESQTGLDFFGRFFPTDSMTIDYALTVSNGRGPTAKLYDLDENKAVGLSLNWTYDGAVYLNLGTYLFIGEYTNVMKGVVFDPITFQPNYYTNITENYIEKTMSFHLKFEWKGLLLQGEYVRGLIRYDDDGRLLIAAESAFAPAYYTTDYVQQAGYALLAYRLPIEAVNLRPYFIYEYQEPSDISYLPHGNNYGGGLNWQITPSVVWKAELYYHQETDYRAGYPKSKLNYGVVTSQLAVSY